MRLPRGLSGTGNSRCPYSPEFLVSSYRLGNRLTLDHQLPLGLAQEPRHYTSLPASLGSLGAVMGAFRPRRCSRTIRSGDRTG